MQALSTIIRSGISKALLLAAIASSTLAIDAPSVFKRITIDGSFADWAGVTPAFEDAEDSATSADYKAVYVAHDAEFIYIRFTLHAPHAQFTSHENIFVDADNDPSTGYSLFVGSEMLIQGGAGYQQQNGGFNVGAINGLNWLAAPTGTGSDFEVRFSRQAVKASDSSPVFAGDTFAFILESEDANYLRSDTAPDIEGITYTLTPPPPPLTDPVDLVTLGSSTWRYLTPSAAPAENWKAPDFDDASWSSGQGAFGYPAQGAPVTVRSPLPTGSSVAYLRTGFNWNNDAAGIVLAASTQLSDGAVFYLNGEEVRRIRMPAGTIGFDSAATGGNSTVPLEVFGIPPGALTIGENVLAVEVHNRIEGNLDLYFDVGLKASANYPVIITDATQPADRSIVAGQSTTFTVEVLGTGPLTYQWFKGLDPIDNATEATYTIPSALSSDQGLYSVRVTNPGGNVTSRQAQLTVTGTPVVITDPTLPADVTTTEGLPVSFTVNVTGSAPVTYQWFKGATAIDGAITDTYTIPNVAPTDAGDYSVQITNPVNAPVSRTAKLIVNSDTAGPGIASVIGTPNKVIVQFTEPVDETTANAVSNYQITGGPAAQSAARDPNDPSRVNLTTTAQTLGAQYSLTITGVRDRFNNVISVGPQTFTSGIVIDGSFDDWASLQIAHTDEQESPAAGTDFKDIWVSSDANFIYIRFTLYTEGNPSTFLNNIFVDADNDGSTGYPVAGIGSEMLIQEGAGYQEKNRAFNEGAINDLDFSIAPAGLGTDFELRISRNAKYASDGENVFAGDIIRFALETENTSFQSTDIAPNSGGLEVILAQGALGELRATIQGQNIVISWDGPGQLQTRPSLTTGDWADVQDAPNPYPVPNSTTGNAFFQLRSTTP